MKSSFRHKPSPRSYRASAEFKPGGMPHLVATNPLSATTVVKVMGYDNSRFEESVIQNDAELDQWQEKFPNLWIDIEGLGDNKRLMEIAKRFSIHPLTMEDIFDARHQPKIEVYDRYLFLILKIGACGDSLDLEQVSLLLLEHVVITVREREGESFAQVHERIRSGTGKIRGSGSDFLACALIDAVLEGYYPILSKIRGRLDAIEDTFVEKTTVNVIRRIHDIKRDLLLLHSAIWPIQEITTSLAKEDISLIRDENAHFIRDCQDQAKQVRELAEFYRLIASDLMNTFLAFSDNKANEVMKVLTMVASIFIPLSFLTGVYGMNFDYSVSHYNMPELKTRYGYPVLLLVMLTITLSLLWMFKRKGWFHNDSKGE